MARDFKLDIDEVMSWKLNKLFRYMAFYLTENEDFRKKQLPTIELTADQVANKMGGWDE